MLATEYAAYLDYAHIQELRGNEESARTFLRKAAELKSLVNTTWWNARDRHFYSHLDKDHQPAGRAGSGLLYRNVVDPGIKTEAALKDGRPMPEVLYRYGGPDVAYARMLDIAFGPKSRREYPEVPFSWVGALVNGTMGIILDAPSALESRSHGWWVETILTTFPGLGSKVQWAELRNLPVRASEITVRHEGLHKTVLTNQRGPSLIWDATFAGSFDKLLVNGQPTPARSVKRTSGESASAVRVTVGAGGTVTVATPE